MRVLQHPLARHDGTLLSGDNLGVVRFCAGTGRLTEPELHGILDRELGRLAATGRPTSWIAVRRRYNKAADEAATEGCNAAASAARCGRTERFAFVHVH
eukprot:5257027-Lingulodinium_polyedra.AAC.1